MQSKSSPPKKVSEFRRQHIILAILAGFLAVILTACSSNPVSRAVDSKERKTVTHFYYVDNKDDQYAFPSEKVIDGTVYQLENTQYKVVHENQPPETEQSILLGRPDVYTVGGTISVKGTKYQITKVSTVPKNLTWSTVVATERDAEESVNKNYTDDTLKQTTSVPYRLVGTKDNRATWKDAANGFKINIVGYGGPYYQIGNFKLSSKKTVADVKKKQALVLDAQGLDPENSRITTVDWDGGPYEDERGNVCRDLLVHYQTRTPGFTAVYQGTVYRYDLTYIPVSSTQNRYYMEGLATYVKTNQKMTKHLRMALFIVLGVAVLVGLVLWILYRRKKRTEAVVAGEGYTPDDF